MFSSSLSVLTPKFLDRDFSEIFTSAFSGLNIYFILSFVLSPSLRKLLCPFAPSPHFRYSQTPLGRGRICYVEQVRAGTGVGRRARPAPGKGLALRLSGQRGQSQPSVGWVNPKPLRVGVGT